MSDVQLLRQGKTPIIFFLKRVIVDLVQLELRKII